MIALSDDELFWKRTWEEYSEPFAETIKTQAEIHDEGVILHQGYPERPPGDTIGVSHEKVLKMAEEIKRLRRAGDLSHEAPGGSDEW